MNWLRDFYASIDPSLRRSALRWGFIILGLISVGRDDVALVWLAWLGATETGFLGVSRPILYGGFVALFVAICVGVYHALNLWLAKTMFGPLPHAGDYPAVIAYAGIVMEALFALFAQDGRYQAEHAPWQMKNPFSRTYIPAELQRRARDQEVALAERNRHLDAP